jgi:hypothetical protein
MGTNTMKLLKSDFHNLTTAIVLGAMSMGFAPAALATAVYDAMAEFTLTLTNVIDANGTQVTSGWDVTASGDGAVFLNDSGAASATGSVSVIDPPVSMSILDSITQSSTSSGSATAGFASTDALTDLDILVENFSGQALTFSFDFSAMTDTTTTTVVPGIFSEASATVDMLDDLGAVDIIANAYSMDGNPATGSGDVIGIISFELMDGEFNLISGFVDSFGSAEAVPVPAAVWLFGSGLLGLIGIARRKKSA